jgi:FlaG/FlaF family flagellin (archaellin)
MKMRISNKSLRKDEKAASPAISTVIIMAAAITMILVAMTYANNTLSLKMAENEYNTNKQFMQTTGQQIDDIAWTVGRTQTVSYSSRYGNIEFQEVALDYTFQVHTSTEGWKTLTLPGETGIILYNMPIGSYSLGNNYFARAPLGANSSFLLSDSSAPINQIICEQKIPMSDGSYNRIALVPTMRVLTSTITSTTGSTNYFKFYLPNLENGTNLYRSQSVTLTGGGISKNTQNNVDQVIITVSFPQAASLGFDSSFFNFKSTTITFNSASTPKLTPGSVVEFYVGKVVVTIGQV